MASGLLLPPCENRITPRGAAGAITVTSITRPSGAVRVVAVVAAPGTAVSTAGLACASAPPVAIKAQASGSKLRVNACLIVMRAINLPCVFS